MKRALSIIALVLVISTSIVAGTLAMYVVEIDDLAEGSVVAKEFILVEGETNTFEENIKIAPGETVDWMFSVKNYDGTVVSETGMDLEFDITLADAEDKTAIVPLVVTVKNEDQEEVGVQEIENGTGTITFTDKFELSEEGQEKTYTVAVEWPWETEGVDDIDFAGTSNGTAIKVSVTGTQSEVVEQP